MGNLPQVVITDTVTGDLTPEATILEGVAEVVALGATDEEMLVGKVEQAAALIVYHELSITRKTLDRLQACKLVCRGGVGIDNVDGAYARELGIPFTNVPDYGSEEVADSAIGMAVSLARGVHLSNARGLVDIGPWSYERAGIAFRFRGTTFGIVGLGRIGTAAAIRAKAFGFDVAFYDPYKPDGYDKALGLRRIETLEELLAQSRIVSLHCPLTEETQHLIDAQSLAVMQPGSYLVNTARGAVVDTSILPDALEAGQLAGAGIDVLPQEPPADDDPLLLAWRDPEHAANHRLILNPHTAFYCEEGLGEMRTKSATACRRAILGQPLRNLVN